MDRRLFLKGAVATVSGSALLSFPPEAGLGMYQDGVFLLSDDVPPEPFDENDGRWHSLICVKETAWIDGYYRRHPDSVYILPQNGIVLDKADVTARHERGCCGFLWHKDYGWRRLGYVRYRFV